MTQVEKDESNPQEEQVVSKRPISERRLQANRANAKRSTGPRTKAGKAISRWNALKHGILSCALDLPSATPGRDTSSSQLSGSFGSAVLVPDSLLGEIIRVWGKLEKVLIFESECAQLPNGLEQNARLICRYERMLTRKVHACIREHAGLKDGGLNDLMKN